MEHRIHRKAINTPGQAHALTFSCYRRLPILADPEVARMFLTCLDEARKAANFEIHAFAVMPEHCHMIVRPRDETYAMGDILKAIKSPAAKAILAMRPELRDQVCVRRRGRPNEFRIWQKGGGYDRNLSSPNVIRSMIRYIHANPVRRGLCESILDYRFSSAPAYHELEALIPVDILALYD